jgi:hypothetical protein
MLLAPAAGAVQSAQGSPTARITAVGLSYNGQHLAWIVANNNATQVVLASPSGRNAHALAIPGDCRAIGLRWAHRRSKLAVVTSCTGDAATGAALASAIWVVNVHANKAPRKATQFAGVAHDIEWSRDDGRLVFLYAPKATQAPAVTVDGIKGAAGQRVASIPVMGGSPTMLTPANLDVYAFRWSPFGHRITYTAAARGAKRWSARLYVQSAVAGANPQMIADPAANKALHGLHIRVPRWAKAGGSVFFIGVRNTSDAHGGHIFRVATSGGNPVDLMSGSDHQPTWLRVLGTSGLLVSQPMTGKVQFARYGLFGGHVRQTASFFSLAGRIGNGRNAGGASVVLKGPFKGSRPRIAFIQVTQDKAPVVRAGLFATMPPPVVASAGEALAPQ